MRFGLTALLFTFVALAGCNSEVNGGDTSSHEVNVGASGQDECPGDLFQWASEGRATCAQSPQSCHTVNGGSPVPCSCTSTSGGGSGTWTCGPGAADQ